MRALLTPDDARIAALCVVFFAPAIFRARRVTAAR
jgi:hypothetical protein